MRDGRTMRVHVRCHAAARACGKHFEWAAVVTAATLTHASVARLSSDRYHVDSGCKAWNWGTFLEQLHMHGGT